MKADGPAAGKGVIVAHTRDEVEEAIRDIMINRVFGPAGDIVLLQQGQVGTECSAMLLADGTTVRWFGAVQDYKRAYDGDQGPNTGGMGAIAPAPILTPELRGTIIHEIAEPLVKALHREGRDFSGMLFLGLTILPDGRPKVLEVNCRFGDPETQALLEFLDCDLLDYLVATANGTLADMPEVAFRDERVVAVTIAAEGYPESPKPTGIVYGTTLAKKIGGTVYHAGTSFARNDEGNVVATGGRVLNVTGRAPTYAAAREIAYGAANLVNFKGSWCRNDIGANLD